MKTKFRTPDPKKAKRYFARKLAFTAGPYELSRWLKQRKDVKVVDVRESKDYAKGHIPGALSLPREKWHKTAALDKSKTCVVYCYNQTCHGAAAAAYEFASQGFPVVELEGGFETWKSMKLPVEKRAPRAHRPARALKPLAQPEQTAAPAPEAQESVEAPAA